MHKFIESKAGDERCVRKELEPIPKEIRTLVVTRQNKVINRGKVVEEGRRKENDDYDVAI